MTLTVRNYQPGDEIQEVAFDRQVVADWPWPVAFSEKEMKRVLTSPSFDPTENLYALDGDKMVGKTEIWWIRTLGDGTKTSFVMFPKTLPGYENARAPLLEHVVQVLIERGVEKLQMWGCTMWEGSFDWLDANGYSVNPDYPRGHKKYVSYDLTNGPTSIPHSHVDAVDLVRDGASIAHAASVWYGCSPEKACARVEEMLADESIVSHLATREKNEIVAVALLAENSYRPSTAAFFYVYARNARALRQLVSKSIAVCIEHGSSDLLVDLIGAHHHFEPTYLDMGFVKVAEHAIYEKRIGQAARRAKGD